MLREPNVASAIVGASRPEQLEENAAASGLAVDPALFRQAEAIIAGAKKPASTQALAGLTQAAAPILALATSGSTVFSNLAKFSANMAMSFLAWAS